MLILIGSPHCCPYLFPNTWCCGAIYTSRLIDSIFVMTGYCLILSRFYSKFCLLTIAVGLQSRHMSVVLHCVATLTWVASNWRLHECRCRSVMGIELVQVVSCCGGAVMQLASNGAAPFMRWHSR